MSDTPATSQPVIDQPAPVSETVADGVVPEKSQPTPQESPKQEPPAPQQQQPPAPQQAKQPQAVYQSKDIRFDDDPTGYIQMRFESLIYWEHPRQSALYLTAILTVLVLTQYFSLLQILAGLFTTTTALNWAYVTVVQQGQRLFGGKSADALKNPHSERLASKEKFVTPERVEYFAKLTADLVNALTQQVNKLVLIEDSWRSGISVGVGYAVWTLAKYVSTKYLIGFFVIVAFSLPRLYHQHQEVVDKQLATYRAQTQELAQKYGGVATEKAKVLYEQAIVAIKKTSAKASKQE